MAAILNFRIFRKIAKHKNAYISKTVLDRAISTLQDAGLGQESFKCEKLCQPHRTGPQQEQRDCLLGSLSPDRTRGWGDRNDCQMSQMWHTTACRVQTKPVWELRKPWGLDPR